MCENRKMSSITIIIPVYNGEKTIQRCLNSVLRQSSKKIEEIIIVDDGSTDKTVEIIKALAEQDARIHCIQKKNSGVSSARNLGIHNAQSEYIMFIDSDDEIKKDLVENLYLAIDGCDMAIAGIELHQDAMVSSIGIQGKFSAKEIVNKYGNDIPGLLINGPWCKLYRKKIIAEQELLFDESLSLGEDTEFVFRYLKYCNNIRFIDYYGYIYYQLGNNSLMTKFRKDGYYNAKRVYGMLTRIVAEICESDVPQNYKRVYRNVLMVYIRKTIYNRKMVGCSYIKDIIKDYVNDEIIRSTIKDIDKANYMQKVINVLVDKKRIKSLYLLLKIHVMARGI